MKINHGNVSVRLRHSPVKVNGIHYSSWLVAWRDETGRKRKRFPVKATAAAFAKSKAELLNSGHKFHLTPDQAAAYNRAHDAALPIGRTLEQLATDAAEADLIAPGVSLQDLARFWALHHSGKQITAVQLLPELLEAKTREGRSPEYIRELRIRLSRFAREVTLPLPSITARELGDWIATIEGSPRSRRNYRGAVAALFNFAVSRRYLPRQWDELPRNPRTLALKPPVSIYTPAELQRLVDAAANARNPRFSLLPMILFGAFAGIRTKEIQRLDWSNVGEEWIEVTPKRTRSQSRRLVPILPALARCLPLIRKESGPICPYTIVTPAFARLATRAGLNWKHNGLRHSFISYRVAAIKNAAEVALECGNSPAMIFQHYRERVTPAQAEAWFAVVAQNGHKTSPPKHETLANKGPNGHSAVGLKPTTLISRMKKMGLKRPISAEKQT